MTNKNPKISVVMAVFDNAAGASKTIESIIQQQDVDLDFVIIDDGAQADVKQVLERYKSHPQINVVHQKNQGLTKALIKGCRLAKYGYIARIDAGDIAKPGRLKKQAQFLLQHPKVVCVTSWVEMVTEEGYFLYDVKLDKQQLQQGLCATEPGSVFGPLHFSTMFRKSSYDEIGQYRPEFYFVQDLDLWLRMQHIGKFDVIPEILTVAEFSALAISGRYRTQQEQLKLCAFESNQLLLQGEMDNEVLERANLIRPSKSSNKVLTLREVDGLYFIAKCLLVHDSVSAMLYLKRVIKMNPFYIKAYFFMLVAWLRFARKDSNEK